MYTISITYDIFSGRPCKRFYKGLALIAWTNPTGGFYRFDFTPKAGCDISRAQAYKYWEKYFPDKPCWLLPEVLQEALEKPCTARGAYKDRNGEWIGYEG